MRSEKEVLKRIEMTSLVIKRKGLFTDEHFVGEGYLQALRWVLEVDDKCVCEAMSVSDDSFRRAKWIRKKEVRR